MRYLNLIVFFFVAFTTYISAAPVFGEEPSARLPEVGKSPVTEELPSAPKGQQSIPEEDEHDMEEDPLSEKLGTWWSGPPPWSQDPSTGRSFGNFLTKLKAIGADEAGGRQPPEADDDEEDRIDEARDKLSNAYDDWVDASGAPLNPSIVGMQEQINENNKKMDVTIAARNKAANEYLDALYLR